MAKQFKTNALRMLDKAKIKYDIKEYMKSGRIIVVGAQYIYDYAVRNPITNNIEYKKLELMS